MMTIKDFNQLSFERKCDFISLFGTHLISKNIGVNISHVYQLGDFFVEMWYDQKESQLLGINALSSMKALDMYLDEISIVDVLAYIS